MSWTKGKIHLPQLDVNLAHSDHVGGGPIDLKTQTAVTQLDDDTTTPDSDLLHAQAVARQEAEAHRREELVRQQAQRLAIRFSDDVLHLKERLKQARLEIAQADASRAQALEQAAALQRGLLKAELLADGKSALIAQATEQVGALIASLHANMPLPLADGSQTRVGQFVEEMLTCLSDVRATLHGTGRTIVMLPSIDVPGTLPLSRSAQLTFSHYGDRGEDATDHLTAFLKSQNEEDTDIIVCMLWESLRIIREHGYIRGAVRFADQVIGELSIEGADKKKISGFTTQAIITAQLLETGMPLTAIETAIRHPIQFNEWFVDKKSSLIGSSPANFNIHLVDALAGDKIIEIKKINLDQAMGELLMELLIASLYNTSSTSETIRFDPSNGIRMAQHTALLTNQLVRYKLLIDKGVASGLELHVVSDDPVHRIVLDAVHGFFEPGTVRVVWYRNRLSSGVELKHLT